MKTSSFPNPKTGPALNELEVHIRFTQPEPKDIRIFDGTFNIIFEGTAAPPGPLIIRLTPGMYLLQDCGTDKHKTLEVIGSFDEVLHVDCDF